MNVSSILFVSGSRTEQIQEEESGFVYKAGKLSAIGLRSGRKIVEEVSDFLKEKYGMVENPTDIKSREGRAVAQLLLNKGVEIMQADFTQTICCENLIVFASGSEDFIEKCYDLAIKVNPKLDPVRAQQLEAFGKAQAETRNEDGTPKSEAETNPLA